MLTLSTFIALGLLYQGSARAISRGLPPGVDLVSPRGNRTIVTDELILSLAFDAAAHSQCLQQLHYSEGCKVCASLDGLRPECVTQAEIVGSVRTTGMIWKYGRSALTYLSSGSHSLVLTFSSFSSDAAVDTEYSTELSFTSTSFINANADRRLTPRHVIDTFTFFDEVDVLELRLRELEADVDLFVVAESPYTHSMRPKKLFLADALAAGDPRWAPWSNRLRCVVLGEAMIGPLKKTSSFHSHEVAQRNILAGAAESIIRNDFGFDMHKHSNVRNDDFIILVSDVDEVPSRNAVQNLRYHLKALESVTYISMAWHHYAFNFGSHRLWGSMESKQAEREAAMAIVPEQLFAAANGSGATLTQLRRGLRDQIVNRAAILDLGGWHLQRFGGFSKVASKLSASPYADAFSFGNNAMADNFEDDQLANDLLNSGLVLTYPSAQDTTSANTSVQFPVTLASATFNWSPREVSALWSGLTFPIASENEELNKRASFWFPRPVLSSEIASDLRWTVVARELRKKAIEDGTLALVATDYVTKAGVGIPIDANCTISCSSSLVSTIEMCRWKLALTTRVGRLATEVALEKCSRLPRSAENISHHEVVLKFKLQRLALINIDVGGNPVDLAITPDFVSEDGLNVGAQASAASTTNIVCKQWLNNDSSMCSSLSGHVVRLANMLDLFFVPMTSTVIYVGDAKLSLHFSCDAPPIKVAEMFCVSNGISFGTISSLLEGERSSVRDPQGCVRAVATRIIRVQAGIGRYDRGENGTQSEDGSIDLVCARRQEDLLDLPLRHTLTLMQFRMLGHQEYLGVETWKFPNDLWVYTELILKVRPTVIIEIGNNAGGSALYLANYLETINDYETREGVENPLDCRMICVDISHSKLHPRATQHPRVARWILADGPTAGLEVRSLLRPDDKVMVIEDASHLRTPTLDLLEEFAPLVAKGSYFVVEDTILHNGATNPLFDDAGAHASVDDFLHGRGVPSSRSNRNCTSTKFRHIGEDFVSDRYSERFILSWNPTGFLKRVEGEGWGDALRARRSSLQLSVGSSGDSAILENDVAGIMGVGTSLIEGDCKVATIANGARCVFEASREVSMTETRNFCESTLGIRNDESSNKSLDDCAIMILARCLAWTSRKDVASDDISEENLHSSADIFVPSLSSADDLSDMASRVFEKYGVVVLDRKINSNAASLKSRVMNKTYNPQFKATLASLSGINQTGTNAAHHDRYMDVLCQWKTDESCRRSGGPLGSFEVLEFIQDKNVVGVAERVLGTSDLLIDSVSLSIQWPGDAQFGPHVDRPIQSLNSKDTWPYSSHFEEGRAPSLLSVQAIWCLDAFTTHNGAFFIDKKAAALGRHTIYTRAGDVIVANGGVLHGAHANRTPHPRVALLVQYVPRFVRPGAQFPRAVLDCVHQPEMIARLERLLDLDKPDDEPSLTVSLDEQSGAPDIFVPPWSDARAIAGAVVRAEIERFCSNSLISDCIPSLEEEVNRKALFNHHRGSSTTGITPLKPTLKGEPKAPSSLTILDHQTSSFVLSNGYKMPALAFGTGGRSAHEVQSAIEVGWRHFDLAESYGNQAELGGLFRGLGWGTSNMDTRFANSASYVPRSDVFISSKVWATNLGSVGAALDLTLQETGLEYLDLYMIHWPVPLRSVGLEGPSQGVLWPLDESGNTLFAKSSSGGPMSLILAAWRELEDAYDRGLVRAIGISNMPSALAGFLLTSARIKPHVHQFEAHPQLPQNGLLAFCHKHGIVPMAHSALGGPETGFEALASDPAVVAATAILVSQADMNRAATPPQLLLQWSLQRNCGAVVSSRSQLHQQELLSPVAANPDSFRKSLMLLNQIPHSRYSRRVVPPAFSFLFADD